MAESGAWTQIESAAPQPGGGRLDAPPGAQRDVAPRARPRRHQRPVLGALDAGGVALQRGAGVAILGAAVFVVPVMTLNLVASRAAFDHFQSFDGSLVSASQLFTGVDSATGVETAMTYLSLLATSLSVALAGAYLALLVTRRTLGQPADPGPCLRAVGARLHVLVIAWVLSHSWMLLADIVAARASIDDLAPTAVLLVPTLVCAVAFTVFVVPVVMLERLGPWRGLRRAVRLARARTATVIGFSFACVLIGGGLRLTISMLPRLIEESGLFSFGRFGWLAEGLAAQVAQLVVVPLIGLSTAMLYLQVRMDAEGLDLVLEAERAFAR
jgi:hypothetical protein